MNPTILCLMGPTAAGKTALAVELVQTLPCEIISVDSAMVYRQMDIGTGKPKPAILKIAPHRLIDLLDPSEHYSAGQFCRDAMSDIKEIVARGKIPLLVGGTMLYFKSLQLGIANLPPADPDLRQQLLEEGKAQGFANLHARLQTLDPVAASVIKPEDPQRIVRALEVYLLTGTPLSTWQTQHTPIPSEYTFYNVGIWPAERRVLHAQIHTRLQEMLANGFVEEVRALYARGDLHEDLPSIRSVGYRQIWAYLAGKSDAKSLEDKILFATRQLAKRQLTWLRAWPQLDWFDSGERGVYERVKQAIVEGL